MHGITLLEQLLSCKIISFQSYLDTMDDVLPIILSNISFHQTMRPSLAEKVIPSTPRKLLPYDCWIKDFLYRVLSNVSLNCLSPLCVCFNPLPIILIPCSDCWKKRLCGWTVGLLAEENRETLNIKGDRNWFYCPICCHNTSFLFQASSLELVTSFGRFLGRTSLLVKTNLGARKWDTSKQRQEFRVDWSDQINQWNQCWGWHCCCSKTRRFAQDPAAQEDLNILATFSTNGIIFVETRQLDTYIQSTCSTTATFLVFSKHC